MAPDLESQAKRRFSDARARTSGVTKIALAWAGALFAVWLTGLEVYAHKVRRQNAAYHDFNVRWQAAERTVANLDAGVRSAHEDVKAATKKLKTIATNDTESVALWSNKVYQAQARYVAALTARTNSLGAVEQERRELKAESAKQVPEIPFEILAIKFSSPTSAAAPLWSLLLFALLLYLARTCFSAANDAAEGFRVLPQLPGSDPPVYHELVGRLPAWLIPSCSKVVREVVPAGSGTGGLRTFLERELLAPAATIHRLFVVSLAAVLLLQLRVTWMGLVLLNSEGSQAAKASSTVCLLTTFLACCIIATIWVRLNSPKIAGGSDRPASTSVDERAAWGAGIVLLAACALLAWRAPDATVRVGQAIERRTWLICLLILIWCFWNLLKKPFPRDNVTQSNPSPVGRLVTRRGALVSCAGTLVLLCGFLALKKKTFRRNPRFRRRLRKCIVKPQWNQGEGFYIRSAFRFNDFPALAEKLVKHADASSSYTWKNLGLRAQRSLRAFLGGRLVQQRAELVLAGSLERWCNGELLSVESLLAGTAGPVKSDRQLQERLKGCDFVNELAPQINQVMVHHAFTNAIQAAIMVRDPKDEQRNALDDLLFSDAPPTEFRNLWKRKGAGRARKVIHYLDEHGNLLCKHRRVPHDGMRVFRILKDQQLLNLRFPSTIYSTTDDDSDEDPGHDEDQGDDSHLARLTSSPLQSLSQTHDPPTDASLCWLCKVRGVESAALRLMALNPRPRRAPGEACKLLYLCISQYGYSRSSYRLWDLVAGLAVRFGQQDTFKRVVDLATAENKATGLFGSRLAKWTDPKSRWYKRWRNQRGHIKWGGPSDVVVF